MKSMKGDTLSALRKRIIKTPSGPGIYRWLDEKGMVLYVGKAKNVRKRLASYVAEKKKGLGPWQISFRGQIADFDVTVCTSEFEALLLETNLIKQLKPKYNVLMKDDKNYIFIRIAIQDQYPKIETIRRFEQDGAKYFGPYMNSDEVGQTLDLLHEALGYRACRQSIDMMNRGKQPERPCLEFQIGRCNGLCAGKITKEEYRRSIDQVISYLKGQKDSVRGVLLERMKAAAVEKKFELAAKLRNYLNLVEGNADRQVATDGSGEDADVLGVAILSNRAHVVVLHRRNGRLIGESHFALSGQAESVSSVLEQFVPQFYVEGQEVPQTVMLQEDVDDPDVLHDLLKKRRGSAVELLIPQRGKKSRLIQLAERNAREKARQMELKWEAEERNTKDALEELKEILNLPALPKRIEGYDISHLGGTETVGSMVVMKDGKAANDQYRSFIIRTLTSGQVDDYKALREVLKRRMRRLTEDLPAEERKWNAEGITFGRALKREQQEIERIFRENEEDMRTKNIRYQDFLVARQENEIIAFARMYPHEGTLKEIKSVWVSPPFRGNKLGQFLIRKILRRIKKGKVYITCPPELESYYTYLRFRYVLTPPSALQKVLAERTREYDNLSGIVMMWEAHQNKVDSSLTARPDLIVIDGGKGQLSTAVEVLKKCQTEIPVIGLAKREEEVFVPGKSTPVTFPADSPAKFLLMRLRDEAHRFSNSHREKRAKNAMTASSLDQIPGLGEQTMKQLLAKFGSVSAIKGASNAQLLEIITEAQLKSFRETI